MVRYVRITYVSRGTNDSLPSCDAPTSLGLPAASNGIATGAGTEKQTSQTVPAANTNKNEQTQPPPPVAVVYRPPAGFSYKTFVPSPVKVAMCSGAPDYEPFSSTWDRARVWLKLVGMCNLPFQYAV